jgi:hypothetical protein
MTPPHFHSEYCAGHDMLDSRPMRHMAHSCVAFWPKTALESAQCDSVLAECDIDSW